MQLLASYIAIYVLNLNVDKCDRLCENPQKTDCHFYCNYYTQRLSIHGVSIGQREEVYFSGGHFANPVKS